MIKQQIENLEWVIGLDEDVLFNLKRYHLACLELQEFLERGDKLLDLLILKIQVLNVNISLYEKHIGKHIMILNSLRGEYDII